MGAYIQFIKEKKNILKSITIICENLQLKNRIFKTEITQFTLLFLIKHDVQLQDLVQTLPCLNHEIWFYKVY